MIACRLEVAMPVQHVRATIPQAVALGHHLHGWFFRRLGASDYALAAELHESPARPLSLGLLRSDANGVEFRVACFDDRIERVLDAIVRAGSQRAELGGPVYEVRPLRDENGRWSPVEFIRDAPDPGRFVTFELITPTSFRRKGLQIPFPLPLNVFGGLVERWNVLFPSPSLQLPNIPALWDRLPITRYRLHTEVVRLGRYSIIGAVGTVTYVVPGSLPPEARRQIGLLARFAEWAGVGHGTPQGFGTVRVRFAWEEAPSSASAHGGSREGAR